MRELNISELINTQYHDYSRYVLESRAIPSVIDGLKPVHRRSLWIARHLAKNDYIKVSKLAGSTMGIHPHGNTSIEDAISNMSQNFPGSNNINWFEGKGAFGSRIAGPGKGIGAARYISVKLSNSFKTVMDVDSDLIKMIPNYDDTEKEPSAFLPIIPTILLNPTQGIAVGFACNILPRKVEDIIRCQQNYIEGKEFREPKVYFAGFTGEIKKIDTFAWQTQGVFNRLNERKIRITELPIGWNREDYVRHLDSLEEKEIISNYADDCKSTFDFTITLKVQLQDEEIYEKFKLRDTLHENITVIDFNGKVRKMTVTDIIKEFTDFRFSFYLKRYKKLGRENKTEFEFKRDLLKVIEKGIFKKFPDLNKKQIEQLLVDNEIKEYNIQRIINVPIYRFGKEEVDKLKEELKELKKKIQYLVELCNNENLRKAEYSKELKEIKI